MFHYRDYKKKNQIITHMCYRAIRNVYCYYCDVFKCGEVNKNNSMISDSEFKKFLCNLKFSRGGNRIFKVGDMYESD